jgi:hypothetical protein
MNIELYQRYLEQYIREGIANSTGSNGEIYEYLLSIRIGKHFVAHREEKIRALKDARIAFEEHRHWPRDIILSQLGIKIED